MSLPAAVALAAAVAVVFTRGDIFKPFRTHPRLPKLLRDLASCPLCSGTWAGLAFALAAGARAPLVVLGAGCAAGCLALLFVHVICALEALEEKGKSP